MQRTPSTPQRFEDFHIDYNAVSVPTLFERYAEVGFLYPGKRRMLDPYFDKIAQNWDRLLNSPADLMWLLTKEESAKDSFASVSVWKQSNYGLLAQHLVSTGNPFLSLKLLLAAQFKAEHHYGPGEVDSGQNWFRPNNRYAYRVFASMFDKLGPEKASIIPFQYLHMPLDAWGESSSCPFTGDVCACVIANRAPLGLNFSFLENRAYYLVEHSLDAPFRDQVVRAMHKAIRSYYADFALQAIPIVTDEKTSRTLQLQQAHFVREYMQSIWLRSGFSQWFEHIQSFLERIERRVMEREAA